MLTAGSRQLHLQRHAHLGATLVVSLASLRGGRASGRAWTPLRSRRRGRVLRHAVAPALAVADHGPAARGRGGGRRARAGAPTTTRAAPTAAGDGSGPSACAVPVVAKQRSQSAAWVQAAVAGCSCRASDGGQPATAYSRRAARSARGLAAGVRLAGCVEPGLGHRASLGGRVLDVPDQQCAERALVHQQQLVRDPTGVGGVD